MSAVDNGVTSAVQPHWFLACQSAELNSQKPLGVQLHGKRYVLFRSESGVSAFDDSCPHRSARLSQGSVVDGLIVCPYHGLRFNHAGFCKTVPSNLEGQAMPKPKMPSYSCFEAEGFVWMYSLADSEAPSPAYWPEVDATYKSILVVTDFQSTPELLIENFVDCSHTNFVHAGDFRGEPKNVVRAEIIEKPTGILIRTTGEKKQDSFLSRLLIGSQALTDKTSRVYTRLYFKSSWKSLFLKWILRQMTIRILAQDKKIVEPQAENLRSNPSKALITVAADAPGIRVRRAYRAYYDGNWNGKSQLSVDYKL